MFNNLGSKIKKISIAFFVVIILCGIIIAISCFSLSPILGILILIATPFLAYLSIIVLYAIGQILENTDTLLSLSFRPDTKKYSTSQVSSAPKKVELTSQVADTPKKTESTTPKFACIGPFTINRETTESYIVPNTVITISNLAFSNCKKMKFVVIPKSVKIIGDNAFIGNENLTIYINAPKYAFTNVAKFNPDNCPIYWEGEWRFDDNGIPILINEHGEPIPTT